MRRRLGLFVGASALSLAMTLTACGGGGSNDPAASNTAGPPASSADPNATFRAGYSVATPGLNPHKLVSSAAAYVYVAPLYDRLTQIVGKDGRPEVAPMAATSWEMAPDGRSGVFTLREGMTFSDGAPVDAAAVKADFDHAIHDPESTVASYFAMIDSVDVIDPTHVKINTNRPAADLPSVLAGVEASLISPKALNNPDLDVHPVGSGPYVAKEIKIGDSATYERRDGYWDPEAQLSKELVIRGYPDDNARLNALRSGQLDLILSKVGQYPQASKLGKGFSFYAYPPSQTYALMMNTDAPGLNNKLVRQALNYAVDRDGINKSLMNGQCAASDQPLTDWMDGYLKSPPVKYTHDVAKAKSLLAQAGVSHLSVDAMVGAGLSPQVEVASALKAQFKDVGVTLNVQSADVIDATARYASKQTDGLVQVRVSEATSAETLRRNFENPRFFSGTTPPAFSAALAPAFDTSISAEERTKTLQAASTVANEDALDVYVCAVPTMFAYTDKVIGVADQGVSYFKGTFDLRRLGIAK